MVMNTSIDRGRSFVYTDLGASDDHAAGEVIVIGTALVGFVVDKCAGATVRAASVTANEIPSPEYGALIYEHEDITVLKNTALVITAGDLVFWDTADNNVNKTASGNYAVGVALEDAASAATTVRIAFDGAHQHLSDVTGEAATFFGATDMTGAEAETLTDTSNADALHVHDTAGLTADCIDATLIADDAIGLEHIGEAVIQVDTIELSNVNLKALNATPIELVAAPGADKLIQFLGAVLILDYGSDVLTESADNLDIEYDDGTGSPVCATIECTGFIDQAADQLAVVTPAVIATMTAAANINKNIALLSNEGDFAGNATADSTMTVVVSYRIVTAGLA